jgi:ABC-type glycerol-3-phosphate transport system substrate-binding protein
MTPRTKALGLAVTMSAGLLLSACGSGGKADPTPSPTAAATTTVTTVTGPQAFLADVAATGFGEKDASESDAKPTQAQAEALVRSAVANLCPEYQAMLPS